MLNTKVKIILAMCFWGAAFVSGRHLAQSYHPFAIAFVRFAVASCFFTPAMFVFSKQPLKLSGVQLFKILILGLTGVFAYNYFFFAGLSLVPAGKASVIIAINPTITAIIASLFLGEGLGWKKMLGALIATSGALTVITQGDLATLGNGGFGKGELFLLGGVLSWVAYTVIGKIALKKIGPMQATALSCLAGSVMLFPFALKNGLAELWSGANLLDWGNFAFLGFFTTFLGFYWYYQGIKELGAAKASSYINLVPVIGAILGFAILGEEITMSFFAGAVMVLLGIKLTQTAKS